MSSSWDPGSWDPASEQPRRDGTFPFDAEPRGSDQSPGPSYEPPSYEPPSYESPSHKPPAYGSRATGSDGPPPTIWSPVETGPRPVFPPTRQGTGPDWQATADLSHRTPVEPTVMMAPIAPGELSRLGQLPQPGQPGQPAQSSRRGRRRGITIGIVVLAVLVVLIAADRVTAYVADRRTASEIVNTYGLSQAPTVHFGGFPFLTQLATSHYRRITVSAKDVPIRQQSGTFSVSELQATLQGVRLSDSEVRVDSLRGDALVGYPAVSELMGRSISYAGQDASGGRIKIELTGVLAVTAGLQFDTASKKFQVRDVRLGAGGQSVSIDILGPLINQLMQPVAALPDGVELDRVDVTADGLRVHGTGSDLVLPR